MRKATLNGLCLLTLLTLLISACGFPTAEENGESESVAQTMVALSATQTAMAEAQIEVEPETEEVEVTEEIAEETEAPTEIVHETTPGSPPYAEVQFFDTDSSANAGNGYVTRGDDFVANLFERPFTENEMVYRPDVDINKAEISGDTTFYYVTITLAGENPDGGLQAAYGVEIDEDRDGRGDLLVVADRPSSSEWDIAGVGVYRDSNNDVGGASIMRPDSGYTGDGYDEVVFSMTVLDDPDAAWARINSGSSPSVTLAFKKSLVSVTNFVWGVWAADNLLDPALIDLHDNITESDAGSPYQGHSTYPLKALNLVDNTCRQPFRFDVTTAIMGLCYVPEPTPELGSISYVVFDDFNNDGDRDSGDTLNTIYDFIVALFSGSCPPSTSNIGSTNSNSHTFFGLSAGNYCLAISTRPSVTTPKSYTINLPAGGSQYREFGFETPE